MRIVPRSLLFGAITVLVLSPALLVVPAGAEEDDTVLGGPRPERSEREHRGRGFGRQHHRQGDGPLRKLFEDMELSEEQRKKVREVMSNQRDRHKEWREEHKAELERIKKQMQELMEQRRKLMGNAPKHGAVLDEIRPILNEEQQKIFDEKTEKMKEHRERFKDRRHRRSDRKRDRNHDREKGDGEMLDL